MTTNYEPVVAKDADIETAVACSEETHEEKNFENVISRHRKLGIFVLGVLVGSAGTIVFHVISRAVIHHHHHRTPFPDHQHKNSPLPDMYFSKDEQIDFDMTTEGPHRKLIKRSLHHDHHDGKKHDKDVSHDRHDGKKHGKEKHHGHDGMRSHANEMRSGHHGMRSNEKKMWHDHHGSSSDSSDEGAFDMTVKIASVPKVLPVDLEMVDTSESLDMPLPEAEGTIPLLEQMESNQEEKVVRRDESP